MVTQAKAEAQNLKDSEELKELKNKATEKYNQ